MSSCQDKAGRHGLLVLGQTWANTAWCRPSIPLCGSFPAPSTPLLAPSVCGVTECGSKIRKGDILDRSFWHTSTVCWWKPRGRHGRAGGAGSRSPYMPRKRFLARPGAEFNKLRLKNCSAAGPERSAYAPQFEPSKGDELKITTHLVPKAVYGGDVIAVNINMGAELDRLVPAVWSRKEGKSGEREGLTWWIKSRAPPQRHNLRRNRAQIPASSHPTAGCCFYCSSLCFYQGWNNEY